VFLGKNFLQMTEIPIETIMTMETCQETRHKVLISSTSKIIQLPGILVIRKDRYGKMWVVGAIVPPNKRNACRNHNDSPKTAKKPETKFSHCKHMKIDPLSRSFCCHER